VYTYPALRLTPIFVFYNLLLLILFLLVLLILLILLILMPCVFTENLRSCKGQQKQHLSSDRPGPTSSKQSTGFLRI